MDKKVLHREISKNNMIITDPERPDEFKSILVDLGLIGEMGGGPTRA